MSSFVVRLLRWLTQGPLQRWPWLLPAMSFAAGWAGYVLIQRSETMARSIAIMALIGWPWLLAENVLGNVLVRLSKGKLSATLVTFVTQNLQQEILFFALPLLLGATQRDAGQIASTGIVAAAAVISTIDPIYHSRIASQPGVSVVFHAFCTFIAGLVVLPIAAAMPLEQALPIAMMLSGAWLILSLPRMMSGLAHHRLRLLGLVALPIAFAVLWELRAHVPPAGLSLKNSRMTQTLDGLQPGAAIKAIDPDSLLTNGIVAFVAIRAPAGLSQGVVFEWWHLGERLDRVPANIQGGSSRGWRTFSRKQNFPADPRGRWRVDVLTPQGQLICRLPFVVDDESRPVTAPVQRDDTSPAESEPVAPIEPESAPVESAPAEPAPAEPAPAESIPPSSPPEAEAPSEQISSS
jgi:hypothetical protein